MVPIERNGAPQLVENPSCNGLMKDLKSVSAQAECGFKSRPGHHIYFGFGFGTMNRSLTGFAPAATELGLHVNCTASAGDTIRVNCFSRSVPVRTSTFDDGANMSRTRIDSPPAWHCTTSS